MNYYMYMYVVIIKLILAILLVALGDTDRLFKLLTIYNIPKEQFMLWQGHN